MANTFIGPKVVVAVSGKGLDHASVVSACQKGLGSLKTQAPVEDNNTEQPEFTASTMFMRDDELANVNMGVFFKAPSHNSPEYFQLKLLQLIMGEY